MMSFLALLIPPDRTSHLLISERGMLMLNAPNAPRVFHDFFDLRLTKKSTALNGYYTFFLSEGSHQMYIEFYNYLLQDAVSAKRALQLFLSVVKCATIRRRQYIVTMSKQVPCSKKRKRTTDTAIFESVSRMYAEQKQRESLSESVNERMHAMSKLLLWTEIRSQYERTSSYFQPVGDFCWRSLTTHYFESVGILTRKNVLYDPVVMCKCDKTKRMNYDAVPLSTAFPVLKMTQKWFTDVEAIVGEEIRKYYNNNTLY